MASKYRPLTRGKLRASDQVLYADFVQDCEAKKRWHVMHEDYIGEDLSVMLSKWRHLKFRRAT